MDSIIDFIFSNFLILFIVVGGLVKLISGNSKNSESDTKTTQPVQSRRQSQERAGNRENRPNSTSKQSSSENTTSVSIEEQQQKQLERLAGKAATSTVQNYDSLKEQSYDSDNRHTISKSSQNNKKEFTKNKIAVKRQLNKKISRNGLIDSVIMAEVLGAPRARKPYKSVITERKK